MANYVGVPGLIAGADLSAKQYYAVQGDTSGDREVKAMTNANAEKPVGILQNDPTSGQAADVAVSGVAKAVYGGTVTRWNDLACDNDGALIADAEVTAQDGADLHHIATALESGVSGDIRLVLIKPAQIVGLE